MKILADNKKYDSKIEVCYGMSRKDCGEKGENAGHMHFLLFPTIFSKALFFMVLKSQGCVVKGYEMLSL